MIKQFIKCAFSFPVWNQHTYTLPTLVPEFLSQPYQLQQDAQNDKQHFKLINVIVTAIQFIRKGSAKILKTLCYIVWPALKSKGDR